MQREIGLREFVDKGRFKILDSASLCRSERSENESRGLQSKLCIVHTRAYIYVTTVQANGGEETARLDAQRWRTKIML